MTVLDRLRQIRALVAADPTHMLYMDLGDGNGPIDSEAWDVIAAAQKLRPLTRGAVTQAERLAVLDLAISDLVRAEIRAVNDSDRGGALS